MDNLAENKLINNLESNQKIKSTINKCTICNKRVGITFFKCKCNDDSMFCAQHRYPETHNCTIDYKQIGQNKIKIDNPIIVADKITKI